ncbi:MAG TPA: hypothetical protein VFK78_03915 [Gemmatimonadales bacterium]|nr:hypothetical protein [Gemmatimonadales bacterium]
MTALLGATLLVAACEQGVGPATKGGPAMSAALAPVAPGTPIALDQWNGTMNEQNVSVIAKGFNPTNPHVGDAVVVSFFFPGSTNLITSVSDFVTDANHTPVGNAFHLVEFVTSGGISMATYVASNVQGFPDPNPDPTVVYAVQATLSQPVSDAGIMVSAWTGADAVSGQPVGAHRSGVASAATAVTVDAGSIPLGAGALAYAVTMGSPVAGTSPPAGFTNLTNQSDALLKADGETELLANAGSVDPQWLWGFQAQGTALASVLALNPAPHLAFTAQPKTTLPLMTIPPVQVTVTDASGNPVTTFSGPVTIAIGHNGGLVAAGTLSGTRTVNAVNGVATFSDLSIDQPGNGYTLVVSTGGVVSAESAPFNIGAF